jgi:hypothetical protein
MLAFWLPKGPLGHGWASRAGTPADLLAGAKTSSAAARSVQGTLAVPFVARLSGTATRGRTATGLATDDLSMRFRGQAEGAADVLLEGEALPGGGIQMKAGRVTLGTNSSPALYRGSVVGLRGNRIVAGVTGPGNRSLRVDIDVSIGQDSSLSGTIAARAGSAAAQ